MLKRRQIIRFMLASVWLASVCWHVNATIQTIPVTEIEAGQQVTGAQHIWHDPSANATVEDAINALRNGEFSALKSKGSTGLNPGAFWTVFSLKNTTDRNIDIHLEYVDHQLIELETFILESSLAAWQRSVSLAMQNDFADRPVAHPRMVIPVTLEAQEQQLFLLRLSSNDGGYVFPSMRVWSPERLVKSITMETALVAFLFGGFLLMSLFALVVGLATNTLSYYMYSVYALSKIAVWATVLGFTHQYLLPSNFHWQYMSISGAFSILCGFIFARMFLETKRYTPKLDKLLILTILNALVLLVSAALHLKVLAIISITLALLLYPLITVIGIVRWRQGSSESGIFALAWSLLAVGLFIQACRDLGFVEHNLINYYWPPVASFVEMLAIMGALGVKMLRLQREKAQAEHAYQLHLQQSQVALEKTVKARTRELELAKQQAEKEAQTDFLTGVPNRRCFLQDAERLLNQCRAKRGDLCLLMFDLDNFKIINDRYGHQAGDKALQLFANAMSEELRDTDCFGRIGGEEFGLLVCDSIENASAIAERLRQKVSQLSVNIDSVTFRLSTSIGVTQALEDDSVSRLLARADKALYNAKVDGRNRVEITTT